jgi:hypothetical protein
MGDEAWMPLKAAIEQVSRSHSLPDEAPSAAFARSVKALSSVAITGGVIGRAATAHWFRRGRSGAEHLEETQTDYRIPSSTWALPLSGMLMEWSIGSLMANIPPARVLRLGGVMIKRASLDLHAPPIADDDGSTSDSRPRLPDQAFNRWWEKMCAKGAADFLSQDELLWLVRGAHPANSIARNRVEAVTSGRKPGPKTNSPAK